MIFKDDAPKGDLDGFIESGSRLQGDLEFGNTFRVDGQIEGRVRSRGNLVVGEQGEIEGEVRVSRVFIAGVVRGSIAEAERVELAASGRFYGDLHTEALVVEDGAIFEGKSTMSSQDPTASEPAADTARAPTTEIVGEPPWDCP